jgi:glycosyltransferase involved in cell wall biosynthesis
VTASPRVLLASQPTVSGVGTCVRELARAGVDAGLAVTVACPAEGDLRGWAAEAGATWFPLEVARAPGRGDLSGLAALRRLAGRHDVVHLHSSKAGALGRLALATMARSRRPPCVFTPHGWSWLVGGRLAPAYRAFERLAARMATVIVAVSPEEAETGRSVLGSAAARLRVIDNGVDTDRFAPEGPAAERAPEPLLVCVGQMYPPKGQDLAITALTHMAHPNARLRLVGDGPDRADLEELAARLGVADRVEWTGKVTDPAPHLRAADVVLVPSRYDGLSLTLLEAMACGRAVVAARAIGTAAVEGVGVLVGLEDPPALARATDRLLDDPAERARLGALARRRAVEGYTLSANLEATVALWRELAA